jgi:hypothetical protein
MLGGQIMQNSGSCHVLDQASHRMFVSNFDGDRLQPRKPTLPYANCVFTLHPSS